MAAALATLTDEELMEHVAARDDARDDAVAELLRRYRRAACRLVRGLLPWTNTDEQEDLVQEACLRVIETLSWRGARAFGFFPWLKPILLRLVLDLKNHHGYDTRGPYLRVMQHPPAAPVDYDAAATGPEPAELAADRERQAAVRAAVERLTPRERAVVQAYFFEGRSLREVASALSLTDRDARRARARALESLAGLLAPFDPVAEPDAVRGLAEGA